VRNGLVGSSRSGYRNKRIGISAKALLKGAAKKISAIGYRLPDGIPTQKWRKIY